MYSFEDHIKAFQQACADVMKLYKDAVPDIDPQDTRPRDTRQGTRDAVFSTLHVLVGNLDDFLKSTAARMQEFNQSAAVTAEAHLREAVATVNDAPVEPAGVPPDCIWQSLKGEWLETMDLVKSRQEIGEVLASDGDTMNYHDYADGLEEGDRLAKEEILPFILRSYRHAAPPANAIRAEARPC
jgi:hypothetical protein